MDGIKIRQYQSTKVKLLLASYNQFQTLLPSDTENAASHKGEDGRYIESLVSEYLRAFLPKDLEILTGFIYRPAVKTCLNNRTRSQDNDQHSSQIDLIVYDSAHYPIFLRFGNNVIVPPEGVVAVISVKKKFHDQDFYNEAKALKRIANLCHFQRENGDKIRGPFLGLVAMDSIKKERKPILNWIFEKISPVYQVEHNDTFDDAVCVITNLSGWSIFKRRPGKDGKEAEYIGFYHTEGEEHLGLQFLLTGILSVYYDPSRNSRERPGFTAFPSGRKQDVQLGKIKLVGLR